MQGDLAVCASPRCNKEFLKTRVNQKCCGNASCRTFYNRHKNGEPLFPTNFKRSARVAVNNNPVHTTSNFSNNLATGVLNGAIVPAMAAIGKGSFVGNIAASAVSSAVVPLVKEFINSGNKIQFSEIDTEMNKWIADKKYWISQRAKIDNGVFPIKSIAGGIIGGFLG